MKAQLPLTKPSFLLHTFYNNNVVIKVTTVLSAIIVISSAIFYIISISSNTIYYTIAQMNYLTNPTDNQSSYAPILRTDVQKVHNLLIPDPNIRDRRWMTPLLSLVDNYYYATDDNRKLKIIQNITILLKHPKLDPNLPDRFGSPLYYSIKTDEN